MDINDIKGPETKEEHLLNDPRTRGPILTSIAREVLIGVFARIETISTAVPHGEAREGLIQRQIYFKPTPKDKDIAVKKMIDDEDKTKPLTDEQITAMLCNEGINVTRRTVAKYREDMKIPSTHQRRVRN